MRLFSLSCEFVVEWRPTQSIRQVVHRLFGVYRARAAGAAGVEREMLGDPRTGLESRVAGHELGDVMTRLGAVAKARQGDVRSELAPFDLYAAMARDGRDLLLQPFQSFGPLDQRDQSLGLLARTELFDAGELDGEFRSRGIGQRFLEIAHHAALYLAGETKRD